ncbi:glycogen biosynthesis protein GlgD, partial [Bacillus thuringiensis]|nr:glycogen biosynthesis protein GlgD [Bacillus thuringiensis]
PIVQVKQRNSKKGQPQKSKQSE